MTGALSTMAKGMKLICGATGAIAVLLLSACATSPRPSSDQRETTGASASASTPVAPAAARACPVAPAPAVPAAGQGGAPAIQLASTVAPSDPSSSIGLTNLAASPQIQCGRTPLDSHTDVVFSTPTANGQPHPLKMDILAPRDGPARPLVVYVTGGGFVSASQKNALNLRTFVAEAGFAVASVQYRTEPDGATWTDGVADVKSAIRYLRAHSDQYHYDATRVAVWGESAGGYLVAMVATTNGMSQFDVGDNLDQSSSVQAVVDKFGPADLSKLAADFDVATQRGWNAPDTAVARYAAVGAGKSLVDNPAAVARANPMTYLRPTVPPFLIMHGNADKIISPSESLALHDALRAAGVQSTRYVLDGANHGDLAFLGDPAAGLPWSTQTVMDLIVAFLGNHLGAQ